MPIYRGTAPLKAYKGDMQPVNIYRGAAKVAGWHSASYSGTSPLTVDCDYNVAPDALTVDGRCVQTGTPDPSTPAPISTITGNVSITGADGAASDAATVALGSNVCASLPDGTHDSYDAVTGVLTKRVGKVVFDGSAGEWWVLQSINTYSIANFSIPISGWATAVSTLAFCDRLIGQTTLIATTTTAGFLISTSNNFFLRISSTIASTSSAFKTWLAANPVTVYYKLATPTTVQLTPHLPIVRTGIKTLTVGADVVPTISATVKSMD